MHFPGTVNVEARLKCSSAVSGIQMTIGLERDGVEVASRTFTNAGSTSLDGNAATLTCINGTYQGRATATVTFPPRHLPSSETNTKTSVRRPIKCKAP